MGKSYKINIIPNTSLWMKLGRTTYTIAKAISELIDNSIDNKVGEKIKVDIHFAVDGDCIGILDNASGMNVETLARALTIAEHAEDGNKEKIGEHGFGLESASSYLGKNLTIYTKTENMDEYLKFKYNQQEFLRKNEWVIDYEYISKEDLIRETGIDFDRGTYIFIHDLNVRLYNSLVTGKGDNAEGTMITKFQSIYKKFIEKDLLELTVHVERKKGTVDHIKVNLPPKQNLAFKVNFSFDVINNGKELKIKGWAGVLDFYDENIKNKKKYTSGFDIISKNKVILQHLHPGYSYHPEKRLVLGEIELENFQTTSDKTDFIRNSDWQSLELILNQYITKPTLYLASTYYLNALEIKVDKNEDFDFNEDFIKVINRVALNQESTEDFEYELLPATIKRMKIDIEEEAFINSKELIIDYMIKKIEQDKARKLKAEEEKAENDVSLSLQNLVLDNEVLNDNKNINCDNKDTNIDSRKEPENIDYNITFNHCGLIIKHTLEESSSINQYTFNFNNGVLNVVSNASRYDGSIYTNLSSYCTSNIINSLIDNTIIITSEENLITPEIILNIRAGVLNDFVGKTNIFKIYNDIIA